jgi:hypothetical protein
MNCSDAGPRYADGAVETQAAGSFQHKAPPEIRGSGYVVDSLEAALWVLHHARSVREGALLPVNLGDDADTTAAVYGQLAGALFGLSGIPSSWVESLAMRDKILGYGNRLFERVVSRTSGAACPPSSAVLTVWPAPAPFRGHELAARWGGTR